MEIELTAAERIAAVTNIKRDRVRSES